MLRICVGAIISETIIGKTALVLYVLHVCMLYCSVYLATRILM